MTLCWIMYYTDHDDRLVPNWLATTQAWIGGVVTRGVVHDPETGEDFDLAGFGVSNMVRDNGTSASGPADPISYSIFDDQSLYQTCTEKPDYPLFKTPQGQGVVVE